MRRRKRGRSRNPRSRRQRGLSGPPVSASPREDAPGSPIHGSPGLESPELPEFDLRSVSLEEGLRSADLAVNARPENARYRYDYYLDNCSTRVRDALDRAHRLGFSGYLEYQLNAAAIDDSACWRGAC